MSSDASIGAGVVAKSPFAAFCEKQWPRIRPFLAKGCDPDQFYSATIAEMNGFGEDDSIEIASAGTAMKNLAMVGLPPGEALKLAYFVPFSQGPNKRKRIQVIIGYRGYVELAFIGGFLKSLHSDVILQGEQFEYWKDETGPRMRHVVGLERSEKMSDVIGAYAIYHTRQGGRGLFVCQGSELAKLYGRAKGNSPWKLGHHFAMCRKTPIRRCAAEWPQVPALKLALRLDELIEDMDAPQDDLVGGNVPAGPPKISLKDTE